MDSKNKNKECKDNNKDKIREDSKNYYKENSDKIKSYHRKYDQRKKSANAVKRHNDYLNKCKEKYKERFDFSKTEYVDSYNKINVTCIEHNETFATDPVYFISDKCKGDLCSECRIIKHSHESFIKKATNKHQNVDFSNTKYVNYKRAIEAVCKYHGKFEKLPRLVLENENICPECIKEVDQTGHFDFVTTYTNDPVKGDEPGVFYELKVTHKPSGIEFIKIGVTSYTSYKEYDKSIYKDFQFEVIDEVFNSNLEVAKIEKEYKNINNENRFHLPKYIDFAGRNELYKFSEEYQLKHSQVKIIRDSLLEQQGGKCPLCKKDVEMPTLDHYHIKRQRGTGLVRGVLCNTCNRLVGVIENNLARNNINYSDAPEILLRMADYLKKFREPYIHPSEKPKTPKLMKSSYNKLVKAVNAKQKVPAYTGKFTKPLEKLFEKYGVVPEFKGSSVSVDTPSSEG